MAEKIGATRVKAGGVQFALQYRQDVMPDQGVCIQVVSEIGDKEVELLKFDCFDQAPHYHYGPENKNERFHLDKTSEGNPVGWTLKQLRTRLPEMLKRAGYPEIADGLDSKLVAKKLEEVESITREMAVTQRRTVTHNRGDEVIQAGNLKFGLEFRELGSDRGLAIHVLSDVAGQEIELLAFDCFENQPHYHYGPRNKDIRIYWDKTLVPDTLRWTLDRFKEGKLSTMIERAGYPGVVAELDTGLIASTLEKDVEPKALATAASHAK